MNWKRFETSDFHETTLFSHLDQCTQRHIILVKPMLPGIAGESKWKIKALAPASLVIQIITTRLRE